jgi:hypothetical protein
MGIASRYEVYKSHGNSVIFTIDNGPDNIKSKLEVPNDAFMTGDWVHVVAVRDADNDSMMIYANNMWQGGTADNSGDISNGEPLWIGESTDETGTAMSGDMNDVRLYGYAMSLEQIDELFKSYDIATSIETDVSALPQEFSLYNNYPNPFNPTTTISFAMKQKDHVKIKIFNALGQLVETLFDGEKSAGIHTVTFNSKLRSSGVYFYRMEVGNKIFNKKMLLLK